MSRSCVCHPCLLAGQRPGVQQLQPQPAGLGRSRRRAVHLGCGKPSTALPVPSPQGALHAPQAGCVAPVERAVSCRSSHSSMHSSVCSAPWTFVAGPGHSLSAGVPGVQRVLFRSLQAARARSPCASRNLSVHCVSAVSCRAQQQQEQAQRRRSHVLHGTRRCSTSWPPHRCGCQLRSKPPAHSLLGAKPCACGRAGAQSARDGSRSGVFTASRLQHSGF